MDLLIKRHTLADTYTAGSLYIDGVYFCETMERRDAGLTSESTAKQIAAAKEKYKCCIATGKYEVKLTYSKSFQKVLPLLVGVVGFVGTRIHEGNTAANSRGCILVGQKTDDPSFVKNSRLTLAKLMERLQTAENITVEIQK